MVVTILLIFLKINCPNFSRLVWRHHTCHTATVMSKHTRAHFYNDTIIKYLRRLLKPTLFLTFLSIHYLSLKRSRGSTHTHLKITTRQQTNSISLSLSLCSCELDTAEWHKAEPRLDIVSIRHVTSSLVQLRGLPVSYRIEFKFKLCCLIHTIRHDRSPKYLMNIVLRMNAGCAGKTVTSLRTRAIPERLRGAFTTRRYTNPFTFTASQHCSTTEWTSFQLHGLLSATAIHIKFGERAFSQSGPSTWDALSDNRRSASDPVISENC